MNQLETETLPNLEEQTKAEEGGPIQDPEQNPLAEDQPKKISAWTILLAIAATVAMLLVIFGMFVFN